MGAEELPKSVGPAGQRGSSTGGGGPSSAAAVGSKGVSAVKGWIAALKPPPSATTTQHR
jgi:hypothetical protein